MAEGPHESARGGVGPVWFDAHLDLAYLGVSGRELTLPLDQLDDSDRIHEGPPAVTLPALRDAGMRLALGTIFTEPDGEGPAAYPAGDAFGAHEAGRAQLEYYHTLFGSGQLGLARWTEEGRLRVHINDPDGSIPPDDYEAETGEMRAAIADVPGSFPLAIGILMENADPIGSPDTLEWWVERGLAAVGMAWAHPSRYAGGNESDLGLTDLGKELVIAMDALRVVHDVSHLCDRAVDDLLEATDRPVMASHSNCRALLYPSAGVGEHQRHLRDDVIKEIAGRGGVIGLNLFGPFVRSEPGPPTVDDAVAHVERICDLTGSTDCVGLGSDMDGGFGSDMLPRGIDTPTGLRALWDALRLRGWSRDELVRFTHGNWLRFFERATRAASA
ncbi:MAG: membrane dipeptidase [Planctomycetota bacterium]